MINEGFVENFVIWMFGEEMLGFWVSRIDIEILNIYIKLIIKSVLKEIGF